jgi:hypothetical protein
MSYSSNLSTLLLYSGIGVKGEGRSTSIPGLFDHNPLSVVSRYQTPRVSSSVDGPLLQEFARLKGRHVGQLWALLQLLFVCTNQVVQLIWLLCDNVIQKPGRDGGAGGQIGVVV